MHWLQIKNNTFSEWMQDRKIKKVIVIGDDFFYI